MPIVIPRKNTPAPAPAAAPAPAPVEPGMTRAEVDALLAERDAAWKEQVQALSQAFSSALSALGAQQPKTPAGYDFKVVYQLDGSIDTIRATPRVPKG